MKSKLSFAFMWTAMLAILGVFSMVTYSELAGDAATKAYAATINSDDAFKNAQSMVSIKNADNDLVSADKQNSKPGKHETMCTLDANDFAVLKAEFDAKIFTVEADG